MSRDHQHLITYQSSDEVRIDRVIDDGAPELYTFVPNAGFDQLARALGEVLLLDCDFGRRKLEFSTGPLGESSTYWGLRSLHDQMASLVNRADALVGDLESDKERWAFGQAQGEIMGGLYHLLMPIIRKYPHLDPDKPGAS